MLSIIITLIIVIQDYRKIHFKSAKWLIFYAIPGIPVGVIILIYGNEFLVKTGLGVLIICYALYTLFAKNNKRFKEDNMLWLFICGFLSGVLGGAYGLTGPPLVVYGKLRQWSPKHFRATLQSYFLPVSFIALIGYYANGLITNEVRQYFLISLTTVIPAIFIGRYLNHKIKDGSFFKYIYWGLVCIGVILIVSSLASGNSR